MSSRRDRALRPAAIIAIVAAPIALVLVNVTLVSQDYRGVLVTAIYLSLISMACAVCDVFTTRGWATRAVLVVCMLIATFVVLDALRRLGLI